MTPTQQVLTPTLRTGARRSAFWVAAVAFLLLVAVVVLAAGGAGSSSDSDLNPRSPGPGGTRAIVEVLRGQGVDVQVVDNLDAATTALSGSADTLLLHDPVGFLQDERLNRVAAAAEHVVLLRPGFRTLELLAPRVSAAGSSVGPLTAGCALPAAVRAGTITGDGFSYRLTDPGDASGDAVACFDDGEGRYAVIQAVTPVPVTVFGATDALRNEHAAEAGNAALALGLLGQHDTLVWYQPGAADSVAEQPTMAELTPPWLSTTLALLLVVFVAAAVWRGRRLGPLMVEHLPVVVPANETVTGRARLYQRSRDRVHALDALRIGTIRRIAKALSLPAQSTVETIAARAAELTARPVSAVLGLLRDTLPATDAELVEAAAALTQLEVAVQRALAVPPASTPPISPGSIAPDSISPDSHNHSNRGESSDER